MKVILIADALTMLVRYSVLSDVTTGTAAISFKVVDATLRNDDGARVTLSDHERQNAELSLADWIEPKLWEHSKGLQGFDAWYSENRLATDDESRVALEAALILARAAYDAGQLSMAEVPDERNH